MTRKPHAGNPHVQFDERRRRGSLLCNMKDRWIRKAALFSAALLVCESLARAEDETVQPLAVGTHERLTVTEETPALGDAPLFVSPLAFALQKQGLGSWTLPLANLVSFAGNTLDVAVASGMLQIAEGTTPSLETPPPATQKAALWLESTRNRADVVGEGETCVAAWHDVREETAAAVRYGYAQAGATPPRVKTAGDGSRDSLFFGGCVRGDAARGMRFMNAQGEKTSLAACHVFAVHAFDPSLATSDADLTCAIFGVESGANAFFTTVQPYAEAAFVNRDGTAQPQAYAARFYRDGGYASQTAPLGTARAVFELEFPTDSPACAETLFNDRNSASGGGQLYEVLVFTNRLTEAERLSVGGYLLQKYGVARVSAPLRFQVASGATVDARAVTLSDLTIVGEGSVLSPESVSWPYASVSNGSAFAGAALSFAGRTIAYDAITLPWKPEPGETLDIAPSSGLWTNLVTSTTGGKEDEVSVNNDAGSCEVRLAGLPATVRKLNVGSGTVALAAPSGREASADAATDHPVPNGDFETCEIVEADHLSRANTATGWTFDQGSLTGEDDPVAVGVAGAGMTGYACANWGAMATGVRQLLFLSTNGTASSSAVRLPAGTYRLRADVCRWTTGTDSWRVEEGFPNGRCGQVPTLVATVSLADETPRALGALDKLTSFMMQTKTFPGTFTLDSPTDVSLALRQGVSHGALCVDNLVFERVADEAIAEGTELIRNGSFATTVTGNCPDWTFDDYVDAVSSARHVASPFNIPESETTSTWGTEFCDDRSAVRLAQQGRAMQDITFPAEGFYQFACWMRPRIKNDAVAYDTRVQVWLESPDGVTTQQVYATATTLKGLKFLEHRALFRVPSAGTWRLCLNTVREWGGEAFVDCVSVRRVAQGPLTPVLSPETEIAVAQGAKLRLDYIGTNEVYRVRYAGRRVPGIISADTRPDFVVGTGALSVRRQGMLVIIR